MDADSAWSNGPVIGVAGPVTIAALGEHLEPSSQRPVGLGGVPVTHLVLELLRREYAVVVATLSSDVDAPGVVLSGPKLRVRVGRYRPHGRARDAFRAERRAIRRAMIEEAPDVVHAHWSYEFALGALSSRRPTVVTLHDWAPTVLGFHRDPYRCVRLLMAGVTLMKGRRFTAVSPYLQQAAGRWRHGIDVVPNGLPDVLFTPRPRRLHTAVPVLISVNSGFSARKNTRVLLRAFAQLHRRFNGCRLELVGTGYERLGAAHRWAVQERVDAGVAFLGPLDHKRLMARLAAADLLVHSSLEESFGLTLLEAMSQGTPVIAGQSSGAVPWVLDDGRAGALTDVSSVEALATTMENLVINRSRWLELSQRGYDHAWSTFRLSAAVDRYLEIYDELMEAAR